MNHLRKAYKSLDIEVDGGVGPSTIDSAAKVNETTIQYLSAICY